MGEGCFPYCPDEMAGAEGPQEWWTCGSLPFLLLAGAVPFFMAAPLRCISSVFVHPIVLSHSPAGTEEQVPGPVGSLLIFRGICKGTVSSGRLCQASLPSPRGG